MNPLTQAKQILQIVDFLNKEHGKGLFFAVLDREPGHWWNIFCQDFDFYMHDLDFPDSKEAIRTYYPDITIIFAYLKIGEVSIEELNKYEVWRKRKILLIK